MPAGFIPTGFSHRRGVDTDFLQSEMARLQQAGQFNANLREDRRQFDAELGFRQSSADREQQRFESKLAQDKEVFDKDLEERKRSSEAKEETDARHAKAREDEVSIANRRETRIAGNEEARIKHEERRVAIDEARQGLESRRFEQSIAEYEQAVAEGDMQKALQSGAGAVRAAVRSDPTLSPEEAVEIAGINPDDPLYGQLLGEAASAAEEAEIRALKIEQINQDLEAGRIDNEQAQAELEQFEIDNDPELATEIAQTDVETSMAAQPMLRNRDFLQSQLERDTEMANQLEQTILPMIGILEEDIGEEPPRTISVAGADGSSSNEVNPEWTVWNSMKQQQDMVRAQLDTVEQIRQAISGYSDDINEIEAKLNALKAEALGKVGAARKSASERVKSKRGKRKKES